MLGLPYPGGPRLAELAEQGRDRFIFPRPMTDRPGLDFSFSGLKTFTLNTINQHVESLQDKADVAFAFQLAMAETLSLKCKRALQETGLKTLVIAGGVSANKTIRANLIEMTAGIKAKAYFPRPEFCTDNAAMIAYAGCQRLLAGQSESLEIYARPRWPMNELQELKSQ